MGLIQSVFCSMTFCVERVLTWTCCAFVLMLLMFSVIILMIYGISVGYHYAQKELAAFAMSSRSTTEESMLRMRHTEEDNSAVVRLVAVNRSEVEHAPQPMIDMYQTQKPGERMFLETSGTPVLVLETERPPKEPEFSPHEKELARRLIGRFRRSRNNTTTFIPFLRPLRASPHTSTPRYNTTYPVAVHQQSLV